MNYDTGQYGNEEDEPRKPIMTLGQFFEEPQITNQAVVQGLDADIDEASITYDLERATYYYCNEPRCKSSTMQMAIRGVLVIFRKAKSTGNVVINQYRLAKIAGISIASAPRYLKRFEKMGWLQKINKPPAGFTYTLRFDHITTQATRRWKFPAMLNNPLFIRGSYIHDGHRKYVFGPNAYLIIEAMLNARPELLTRKEIVERTNINGQTVKEKLATLAAFNIVSMVEVKKRRLYRYSLTEGWRDQITAAAEKCTGRHKIANRNVEVAKRRIRFYDGRAHYLKMNATYARNPTYKRSMMAQAAQACYLKKVYIERHEEAIIQREKLMNATNLESQQSSSWSGISSKVALSSGDDLSI